MNFKSDLCSLLSRGLITLSPKFRIFKNNLKQRKMKEISFENYHLSTKAYWKAVTCEPEDFKCSYDNMSQGKPEIFYKERKADYVSFNRDGDLSSAYWYCHDKNGRPYILRFSNHWMIQSSKETKIRNRVTGVASCRWYLKAAVRDPLLIRLDIRNSNYYAGGRGHLGKCYLDSFSKR